MIFYRFGGHYSGRKDAAWADLCERHDHQAIWRSPSLENEPVAGTVRGKVDAGAAAIADHLRVHKVGGGEVGRLTEPVRRLLKGTCSQSRILRTEFHERRRQAVHCRLHWMSLNEWNNFMVFNNKKPVPPPWARILKDFEITAGLKGKCKASNYVWGYFQYTVNANVGHFIWFYVFLHWFLKK